MKDDARAERVRRMQEGMRADQVAGPVVGLCAPGARDVSGQIFAARGNELFLMSPPRPIRGMTRLEGWTPESIVEHARPALQGSMVDLGPTRSVFTWEPV